LPEDDTSLADNLFNKVKVLCWVKTYPGNKEQVKATINTWGKRCNKLIFISSKNGTPPLLYIIKKFLMLLFLRF